MQACSHKWPTVEEAQGFDGLLLTGSHYSAYDDSQTWIPELAQILKAYVDAGDVRIMGCCFGHQVRGIVNHGDGYLVLQSVQYFAQVLLVRTSAMYG